MAWERRIGPTIVAAVLVFAVAAGLLVTVDASSGGHSRLVVITLSPSVLTSQVEAIHGDLSSAPDVASYRFVSDVDDSYVSELPCHSPGCGPGSDSIIQYRQSDQLPSVLVWARGSSDISALVTRFETVPGVFGVVAQG